MELKMCDLYSINFLLSIERLIYKMILIRLDMYQIVEKICINKINDYNIYQTLDLSYIHFYSSNNFNISLVLAVDRF